MPRFYTKPQTNAIPDPFSALADVIARDPGVRRIRLARYARRNRACAFAIVARAVRPPSPPPRRIQFRPAHRAASNEGSDVDAR
jgi:hypothetical protein